MLKRSIASCRRGELVEQQLGAAPRHLADRVRTAGRHPDRRMRLLPRRRLDDDVLEIPVLAVMREALVRGPGLDDQREAFLEALVGLLHRDAEARELVVAVALADAEFEPAAGQQIDGGRLLGEQHRVVPGQHHHGGAEPQRLGARREPGQQVEARRDLAEAGEMMLDHEGRVVAQRLGLDVVFDVVAKALTAVEVGAAALRLGAAEQSEFHVRPVRGIAAFMHVLT